mmetsp:Transcript_117019/g.377620  ORF Transcript_117019/g.377620 Transcript_117019/m.377620 type:complete len:235 (+) Transcript_117019:166-870(+)
MPQGRGASSAGASPAPPGGCSSSQMETILAGLPRATSEPWAEAEDARDVRLSPPWPSSLHSTAMSMLNKPGSSPSSSSAASTASRRSCRRASSSASSRIRCSSAASRSRSCAASSSCCRRSSASSRPRTEPWSSDSNTSHSAQASAISSRNAQRCSRPWASASRSSSSAGIRSSPRALAAPRTSEMVLLMSHITPSLRSFSCSPRAASKAKRHCKAMTGSSMLPAWYRTPCSKQ